MWLIIYIRRGVFVARFDRSGKFEDLKAGTGNSEGSTLLVHETSVSACFPILTSGKGPKGQPKINRIMAILYSAWVKYKTRPDTTPIQCWHDEFANSESEAVSKVKEWFNRNNFVNCSIEHLKEGNILLW